MQFIGIVKDLFDRLGIDYVRVKGKSGTALCIKGMDIFSDGGVLSLPYNIFESSSLDTRFILFYNDFHDACISSKYYDLSKLTKPQVNCLEKLCTHLYHAIKILGLKEELFIDSGNNFYFKESFQNIYLDFPFNFKDKNLESLIKKRTNCLTGLIKSLFNEFSINYEETNDYYEKGIKVGRLHIWENGHFLIDRRWNNMPRINLYPFNYDNELPEVKINSSKHDLSILDMCQKSALLYLAHTMKSCFNELKIFQNKDLGISWSEAENSDFFKIINENYTNNDEDLREFMNSVNFSFGYGVTCLVQELKNYDGHYSPVIEQNLLDAFKKFNERFNKKFDFNDWTKEFKHFEDASGISVNQALINLMQRVINFNGNYEQLMIIGVHLEEHFITSLLMNYVPIHSNKKAFDYLSGHLERIGELELNKDFKILL